MGLNLTLGTNLPPFLILQGFLDSGASSHSGDALQRQKVHIKPNAMGLRGKGSKEAISLARTHPGAISQEHQCVWELKISIVQSRAFL